MDHVQERRIARGGFGSPTFFLDGDETTVKSSKEGVGPLVVTIVDQYVDVDGDGNISGPTAIGSGVIRDLVDDVIDRAKIKGLDTP